MSVNRFQWAALGLLLVFPFVPGLSEVLPSANQAAVYTIVAASLVLLTGWVGQISLGHAALVGIGSYATGWAAGALNLPFPLNLPVAALVAGAMAALLGIVALRVRGLYLAVATLIFSWAASEFLFRQRWVLDRGTIPQFSIGSEGTVFRFDFSSSRIAFFYIAWGIAVAALYGLTNLRDSKTGRAFFAIRGSEMAAASLGMDVLKYKALAFTLSGALAGVAGNLIMTEAGVVSPDSFAFNASLFFLAIAVVGGLASLPGAVAASVLFASLGELFFRVQFLGDYLQLVSTALLAIVFRVYPGGLAALGRIGLERLEARRRPPVLEAAAAQPTAVVSSGGEETVPALKRPSSLGGRLSGLLGGLRKLTAPKPRVVSPVAPMDVLRMGEPQANGNHPAEETQEIDVEVVATTKAGLDAGGAEGATAEPSKKVTLSSMRERGGDASTRPDPSRRHERRTLIAAEHITVRFGGLVAVNDASLTVREGEIVGLIGPNGAGKTTLFNSIAGFNTPTSGRVSVYGVDATNLPVHQRAQLGMARTFQRIQLFPQLTVFDNLLAATHLQNPTGFVQHMAVTRGAFEAEAEARQRVRKVIELIELEEVASRSVADLPFGTLRMVEVARALVTGSRLVMLDEPASGLDERETDRLTDVLRFVRDLGATLLLIEHDVRMVTGVSDYMYVLNQGEIIAEGGPAEIQSNEDVIAAYLGQPAGQEQKAGVA